MKRQRSQLVSLSLSISPLLLRNHRSLRFDVEVLFFGLSHVMHFASFFNLYLLILRVYLGSMLWVFIVNILKFESSYQAFCINYHKLL